jgi:hypothetical protein
MSIIITFCHISESSGTLSRKSFLPLFVHE